jgi:hypothetical protein
MGTEAKTTYFGLWPAAKLVRARELLSAAGIRYEIPEYVTDQAHLEAWSAWDPDATNPHLGFDLWIWTEDVSRLGTKLVDAFPERRFGA